jgi:hypothetical protein
MTTWNHRVIVYDDNWSDLQCCIHEVFYDEKGKIVSWTADAVGVSGNNKKELLQTLKHMKAALNKPFLVEKKKRGRLTLVEYEP